MFTKKIITLVTLLSFLMAWVPIARADDIDHDGEEDGFVELKTGETVTEDGFFFNHSALSQLIAKQETKLSLLANEKDTVIKKLNLDLETLNKKKEIELNINKDMYESLLKIRQDRIDQLVSEQRWSDAKMFGGFVLGFAVTIAIFYAAVQVK